MTLLGVTEAAHFNTPFRSRKAIPHISFRHFGFALVAGQRFTEGTTGYEEFRVGALREVDRLLFLSMSNYRRSLDLLLPGASAWAHVTMYYSTFFAAKALMGMFGSWLVSGRHALEPIASTPGTQVFEVQPHSSAYRGSHERMWEHFYGNATALSTLVDPSLRFALSPIGGRIDWLTAARNDVNYDSELASRTVTAFQSAYDAAAFPATLPGALNSQYRVMEALLQITVAFAKQLKLRTDALDQLKPKGSRQSKARALIAQANIPALPRGVNLGRVIG